MGYGPNERLTEEEARAVWEGHAPVRRFWPTADGLLDLEREGGHDEAADAARRVWLAGLLPPEDLIRLQGAGWTELAALDARKRPQRGA